jgi:uncharacterized membrane protein
MQARRTAWEWAVWLNGAFVVATHLDADPIMLGFGFVIEQLLVGTGVGLVTNFVLGRLQARWKGRAPQPFLLSAMVAAAPWLLNAVAVASAFASGISTTEVLLVLVLGTCILGTLAAFGLALARRRRIGSIAALAFGSLIAVTIFWLRSPLPWILQVLCAAALATLFIQACRAALPASQEGAIGGWLHDWRGGVGH